MNERIKELLVKAGVYDCDVNDPEFVVSEEQKKFAELIVQEHIDILKKEWYTLNNANLAANEDESPRDIGFRVGAKSQTVRLMNLIRKHFGVKNES